VVCVCVALCLEYRPDYRIASSEFNIFDVRYKNSEAKSPQDYSTLKNVSQMCETKNQYACNFQRRECIFDDLLLLSSVSYALSHSIIIMVNYITRIVKGSGRGKLNIARVFSSN
jgi:hypothetical protein